MANLSPKLSMEGCYPAWKVVSPTLLFPSTANSRHFQGQIQGHLQKKRQLQMHLDVQGHRSPVRRVSESSSPLKNGSDYLSYFQRPLHHITRRRMSDVEDIKKIRKSLQVYSGEKTKNIDVTGHSLSIPMSIESPYIRSISPLITLSAFGSDELPLVKSRPILDHSVSSASSASESNSSSDFKSTVPIDEKLCIDVGSTFNPDHSLFIEVVNTECDGDLCKKRLKCRYVESTSVIHNRKRLPDIVRSSEKKKKCTVQNVKHRNAFNVNLSTDESDHHQCFININTPQTAMSSKFSDSNKQNNFAKLCNRLCRVSLRYRHKNKLYANSPSSRWKRTSSISLHQRFHSEPNDDLVQSAVDEETTDVHEDATTHSDGQDSSGPRSGGLAPHTAGSADLLTIIGVGRWQAPLFITLFIMWMVYGAQSLSPILLNAPVPYVCSLRGPSPQFSSETAYRIVPNGYEDNKNSCIGINQFATLTSNPQLQELWKKPVFPDYASTMSTAYIPSTSSSVLHFVHDEFPTGTVRMKESNSNNNKDQTVSIYNRTAKYITYGDKIWIHGIDKLFYSWSDDELPKADPRNQLWKVTGQDPCPSVAYDHSIFQETLVSQFDMVCSRAWLRPFVTAAQTIGDLLGGVGGGLLADKLGRSLALKLCAVALLFCGCACASVASSLAWWLAAYCGVSTATHAAATILLVLALETCPANLRGAVGMGIGLPYSLGVILFGGFGYLLRSWRHLYMVTSFPAFLILPVSIVLHESPEWQLQKGSLASLQRGLQRALAANKRKSLAGVPAGGAAEGTNYAEVFASQQQPHLLRKASWWLLTLLWLLQGVCKGLLLSLVADHLPDTPFLLIGMLGVQSATAAMVGLALLPLGLNRGFITAVVTSGATIALAATTCLSDMWWLKCVQGGLVTTGNVLLESSALMLQSQSTSLHKVEWRCSGLGLNKFTKTLGLLTSLTILTYVEVESVQWIPLSCVVCGCLLSGILALLLPKTSFFIGNIPKSSDLSDLHGGQ